MKLDTHAAFNDLTAAGLTKEQAEAVIATVQGADTTDLATKQDITLLKQDLTELRAATKQDLAELKAEIFKMMLAQTFVIIGAVVALVKLL